MKKYGQEKQGGNPDHVPGGLGKSKMQSAEISRPPAPHGFWESCWPHSHRRGSRSSPRMESHGQNLKRRRCHPGGRWVPAEHRGDQPAPARPRSAEFTRAPIRTQQCCPLVAAPGPCPFRKCRLHRGSKREPAGFSCQSVPLEK